MITVIAKTRFIAPVDFSIFLFGLLLDSGIFLIKPLLNGFGILLISPLQRLLRGKVPAIEIVMAAFAELAEPIHAFGTKIFVQLGAGFGRVARPIILDGTPVSASPVPYYWNPNITCEEIEVEKVDRLVKNFGKASKILIKAGIDGVEIHGHEGYIIDQFTSPIWNKRNDKYGCDLSGRINLPIGHP